MTRIALRPVFGVSAAAGPLVFTITWVVASASSHSNSPWESDISALSALDAPQPWITISGELAFAAAVLALATGLAITLTGRDVAVGVAMLTATGLAIAVQAVAREDCDTGLTACVARQQAGLLSWHHSLHGYVSALSFMTSLAAPIILARPFRHDPRWAVLAPYSVFTTCAGLTLLAGYVAAPTAWTGVAQRAFVTIPAVWIAVLGLQLIRRAPRQLGVATCDPLTFAGGSVDENQPSRRPHRGRRAGAEHPLTACDDPADLRACRRRSVCDGRAEPAELRVLPRRRPPGTRRRRRGR